MFDWIGSGIQAAGNLIGGLIGARSNERAAERQMEMQQDLINRQNVYNSPANQMRRLQEAGLNPNLVYGGGAVTGNQSGTGSAPTVASSGDYGLSKATDSINTYMAINNHDMDMRLKQQTLSNNDVVNKNADLQAQAQLEKTKSEDKVLKSQLLTNQMTNDILKHDLNIIKENPGIMSKSKFQADYRKVWDEGVGFFRDGFYKFLGGK